MWYTFTCPGGKVGEYCTHSNSQCYQKGPAGIKFGHNTKEEINDFMCLFLTDFGKIPEDDYPVALHPLPYLPPGTVCLHAGQRCSNTSSAGPGGQHPKCIETLTLFCLCITLIACLYILCLYVYQIQNQNWVYCLVKFFGIRGTSWHISAYNIKIGRV